MRIALILGLLIQPPPLGLAAVVLYLSRIISNSIVLRLTSSQLELEIWF